MEARYMPDKLINSSLPRAAGEAFTHRFLRLISEYSIFQLDSSMFAVLWALHGQWIWLKLGIPRPERVPLEARPEIMDTAIMRAVLEGDSVGLGMLFQIALSPMV